MINSALPHLRYLSGPPLLPQLIKYPAGARGLPFRFFRWLYQKYLFKSHPVYEYHQRDQYVINSEYTAGLFKDAHQVQLPVVYPPITFSDAPLDWEDIGSGIRLHFFFPHCRLQKTRFDDFVASAFEVALRCNGWGS